MFRKFSKNHLLVPDLFSPESSWGIENMCGVGRKKPSFYQFQFSLEPCEVADSGQINGKKVITRVEYLVVSNADWTEVRVYESP